MPETQHKKNHKSGFLLGILFFSIIFCAGVRGAEAAPIKILSNSRHAYGTIISTIDQLLGRAHNPTTEFVIHSTSMNDVFAGGVNQVLSSTSRYDESGALVASQAPYQIYTNSFSGYFGDFNTVNYNLSATYDLADNYAYISSVNGGSWFPPIFRIAPGNANFGSGTGIEWTLPTPYFDSYSLSGLTAANAGVVAWLRFNHPTWNWLDTKAALRQTASNWATGYSTAAYGFGTISTSTANALSDGQILLQPPAVATSTSGINSQITFTVYPFKQTRRVKEALFQFASDPGFQTNELILAQIQALGGTKITEYSGTTATTTVPIFTAVTSAYFVWFTADNNTDSAANFSRIDTYNVLGPLSQNEAPFNATFDISSPVNNAISATPSPTFAWNAAGSYLGISKYQLFIDGALDKDNISGTSATPTSNLSEGAHTWYVKAFNGGGTATSSVSTRTLNIISGYAAGYTFYVDNVLGSDNNPAGTQALPWATLSKAGLTAAAGDTVIIIKNTSQPYRESFTTQGGNSTDGNITFRGVDRNSKPEIWGSDDVSSGWSTYGGGNPNTYQKSLTTQAQVVAVGATIGSLAKMTQGASAATLNPGEWFWTSSVLYYRLDSGENISTLHIEAAQRSTAVVGSGYNTFKDIIVRYVNGTGVSIAARSIAEQIEAYDSSTGVSLSGSGTSASAPGPTLRYSVLAGNTTGIALSYPYYARIYNNISYGNGTGIYVQLWAHNSIFRNNIFNNNTSYDVNFNTFGIPQTNFIASHNNWLGTVDSYWQDTYQGTSNQALTPLITDGANRNFRPQPTSPNIDSGIAISGLTTDILGNPIYGTPDIGPYEYQPPYSITASGIPIGGTFRVYKDGRYRMTAATTSATTANMTISPEGGFPSGEYSEFLNVTINSWNTSGDYSKSWTESSSSAGATTHTVGDLAPNAFYAMSVDGARQAQFRADANGQGTFTYSGGYSTHTFSIAPDLSIGNGPIFGSSFGLPTPLPDGEPALTPQPNTSQTTPTLSGTSSVATSTLLILSQATTTPPNVSSPVTIRETITKLQSKLIVLLKRLVVLLEEELQNIKKTI